MSTAETIALLNELLEGERAGARAVGEMARAAGVAPQRVALRDVAMDEARFCAMLSRHVARLGGSPSRTTGAFRSEEHTSELQSLMRISYAVFCLKKKQK